MIPKMLKLLIDLREKAWTDKRKGKKDEIVFTSLPLPSPDTILACVDAPFGVDDPNVSRLPPSIEN